MFVGWWGAFPSKASVQLEGKTNYISVNPECLLSIKEGQGLFHCKGRSRFIMVVF